MNITKVLDLHKKWLNNEPGGMRANLRGVNLCDANLRGVNLMDANLTEANLSFANLKGANLRGAILVNANLRGANLTGANISFANLKGANLSDVDGLLSSIDYLNSHFKRTDKGYIAYKIFGQRHALPDKWDIQPNSVISENVNFDRCRNNGCGINVGTLEWIKKHNPKKSDVWKVLIKYEWLAGACVPYHTDGNIRCERVQLIEIVKEA